MSRPAWRALILLTAFDALAIGSLAITRPPMWPVTAIIDLPLWALPAWFIIREGRRHA